MNIDPNIQEKIKIIIAGLDNAGKTSFLIALRKKYNFYEEVQKLKPTIKIDYSSFKFLNHLCSLWDMGGQEKYRKIYMNNPIYFTATKYLYYIIDIQDELRLEESAQYLHELLEIYRGKDIDYSNEILICFNKYDPKYKKNEEFSERTEMIKNVILIQNKDFQFRFFNMSYYDISSLSKALSYSLSKLLNLETINATLEKIMEEFDCGYVILYTESGLIITDYYKELIDPRDFEEKIVKINDDLEFFQRLIDEKISIDERITFSDNKVEYVKRYDGLEKYRDGKFYLGVSYLPKK